MVSKLALGSSLGTALNFNSWFTSLDSHLHNDRNRRMVGEESFRPTIQKFPLL